MFNMLKGIPGHSYFMVKVTVAVSGNNLLRITQSVVPGGQMGIPWYFVWLSASNCNHFTESENGLPRVTRKCWFDSFSKRRSNQSILKEINPGITLEGRMLKLKLQYFGHLMQRVDSLEKTLMLGRDWGQEEKGTTEDEMAGWQHQLCGREFEWTPGIGDGQGGLACCDSWGRKESDTTEWLNWTEQRKWQRTPVFLPRESHGAWWATVHRVAKNWTRQVT